MQTLEAKYWSLLFERWNTKKIKNVKTTNEIIAIILIGIYSITNKSLSGTVTADMV